MEEIFTAHQGNTAFGASRIELSEQVVATVNAEAVVGLHAAYELDSVIVDPDTQDSGSPILEMA